MSDVTQGLIRFCDTHGIEVHVEYSRPMGPGCRYRWVAWLPGWSEIQTQGPMDCQDLATAYPTGVGDSPNEAVDQLAQICFEKRLKNGSKNARFSKVFLDDFGACHDLTLMEHRIQRVGDKW